MSKERKKTSVTNTESDLVLQCMAEVGEEWIWLVYRCSYFFRGGGGAEVAHLTHNNVALQKYLFSYSRNGFELSFYFKNYFMPY